MFIRSLDIAKLNFMGDSTTQNFKEKVGKKDKEGGKNGGKY